MTASSPGTFGEQVLDLSQLRVDALQRRFQYSLKLPVISAHLSTIDVIELGTDRCCCVYGVDAMPAVMAIVVAGAAADGLDRAKELLEGA